MDGYIYIYIYINIYIYMAIDKQKIYIAGNGYIYISIYIDSDISYIKKGKTKACTKRLRP